MRLGLLPPAQRSTLDESRPAPLREADVDDIEVPRHDRLREDRASFARDLGPEVAVGEMGQDQHLHAGRAGELRRADCGGMEGLVRPFALFRGKGRLVDEHVGVLRRVQHGRGRARVSGEDDPATRSRRAKHLLGGHGIARGQPHRLAALEPSEQRTSGNAQGRRRLHVEAARPGSLGDRVAVR
jgi:hypothetical protein